MTSGPVVRWVQSANSHITLNYVMQNLAYVFVLSGQMSANINIIHASKHLPATNICVTLSSNRILAYLVKLAQFPTQGEIAPFCFSFFGGFVMVKTRMIGFRLTPQQRQKLELLAAGERATMTDVIVKLIDTASVEPVEIVHNGLVFRNDNTGAIRQDKHAGIVA